MKQLLWLSAVITFALALVLGVLPAPLLAQEATEAQPADWPMYNHDVAGWRFNPVERALGPKNVGTLVEKWRFPAAGAEETIGVVHATPAVVAGEVYFGTATSRAFYKLAPDGTLLWMYRPPVAAIPDFSLPEGASKKLSATMEGGIFSSALVSGGAVYFADCAGWMYCLDAATGAERWKIDTRAPGFPGAHKFNVLMASPILADGKVVFSGGPLFEQAFGGTKEYPGSTGRGFLVALDPKTGEIQWKHEVGPKPQKLDPPVVMTDSWGTYTFEFGPATSSIWSTPSYDPESNTIFFGTDVNTAPRQPTADDPRLYTEDSCAIVAVDAATGKRKWNTQLNPDDVWTNSMRAYDPETGLYKDGSIGDTPKLLTLPAFYKLAPDGTPTKAVGVGCKNGGFYLLRADDGSLIRHTPLYTGRPIHPPAQHDPRVLALPSPIGGLQTGCATDGRTIYTNGIDVVRMSTQASRTAPGQVPTAGRVTATSVDLETERWRHERPKVPAKGGTPGWGDMVASGIAVGNGVAYFTTVISGKLVALDTATGMVLCEIEIGPVFAGPSLSRGRVYIGTGNTLFSPHDGIPKQDTGTVRSFGLPGEDEVDRLAKKAE